MRVLNLLQSATVGGIEKLCMDIAEINMYDNTFVFLFQEGLIYEEMKKNGADVYSLAAYGSKKTSRERLEALANLAKPFDVIVVHHSALAIQMCYVYLKKKYPEKKFVLVAHSCFEKKYYYEIYSSPVKRMLRKHYIHKAIAVSDRLVFVSEAGKKSYINNFSIPEEKTRVIYNGIFLPDLNRDKCVCHNESMPYRITFIGRLEEIKGVQNLIKAISLIKKTGIKCTVSICGDGSYRETLEQLSKDLNTEEVKFEGVQRDIEKYLCNSDIFVYPSICEEVFGISIVEALSYGVPCIANRVGGIPEILKDNWNGVLCRDLSADSLSEAIQRVVDWYKNDKISSIRENCLETANRFTIQNTVAELKKCFEELN